MLRGQLAGLGKEIACEFFLGHASNRVQILTRTRTRTLQPLIRQESNLERPSTSLTPLATASSMLTSCGLLSGSGPSSPTSRICRFPFVWCDACVRKQWLIHSLDRRETRGADVSLDECEEMIGSIDADGDGVISYEEFVALHEDHMI